MNLRYLSQNSIINGINNRTNLKFGISIAILGGTSFGLMYEFCDQMPQFISPLFNECLEESESVVTGLKQSLYLAFSVSILGE